MRVSESRGNWESTRLGFDQGQLGRKKQSTRGEGHLGGFNLDGDITKCCVTRVI